jgi:hypothetical protein
LLPVAEGALQELLSWLVLLLLLLLLLLWLIAKTYAASAYCL